MVSTRVAIALLPPIALLPTIPLLPPIALLPPISLHGHVRPYLVLSPP